MNVREFNSIEELSTLRTVWAELLQQTPQATFFQSLDWLEVYWKHFGAGQRLRVLAIDDGPATVAILPLVVRRERTRVGSLRFLTYPLDFWGSFYAPIGPLADAAWTTALDYLHATPRDWDILEPRWIGQDADQCAKMDQLLRDAGWKPVISSFDATAVVDVDGSFDDYLAQRSTKWRNNFRRWNRRIEELGDVNYLRYRPAGGPDGEPRWDLYDQCIALAQSSWQGASRTGTTLTHAAVADFLRDVHAVAARCGCLDMNLLYLDQRPIAFAYNYYFGRQVFGLRIGYDPELKKVGVGNVLYSRSIQDSFQRADVLYDMGPGTLEAKRQIWSRVIPLYRLSCYRSLSLRQQVMRWKRRLEARKQPAAV